MKKMAQVASAFFVEKLMPIMATLAITAALGAAISQPALAQTFSVLHTFSGGRDGAKPVAGLTIDASGNLYGTAEYGGYTGGDCAPLGCGTVFKLTRKNSAWILSTLYTFMGGSEGQNPKARVVFGPDGTLYGTTSGSTISCGNGFCGTVFNLKPPATTCRSTACSWSKTVLAEFDGTECYFDGDDNTCTYGDLAFDSQRNIYGTLTGGGTWGQGSAYELSQSGGVWTVNIIYSFLITSPQRPDGLTPYGGVIFDRQGNLWGTTAFGGGPGEDEPGPGVVFELTPSDGAWTESISVVSGAMLFAGLTMDDAGNFFGATFAGGGGYCFLQYPPWFTGCGTAFRSSASGSGVSTIYSFFTLQNQPEPGGPMAPLTLDAAGNLYGTSYQDTNGAGSVFKLTAGEYAYSSLHDFNGGSDGANPISNVTIDSTGNLYGTASTWGTTCPELGNGCGTIWEITP
jgi:hypothetical protein